jgi:lipopolysaccharide export system protein LptA
VFNYYKIIICIGLIFHFLNQNIAQVAPPAVDTGGVEILQARLGEFVLIKNEMVRKLVGSVCLRHKDALMYCDSAILDNLNNVIARGNVVIRQADSINIFADSVIYKGFTRTADLSGKEVALVNNDKKLFTKRLNYDLKTKIATYDTKATLSDGKTNLTSKRGTYNAANGDAFFKEKVIVEGETFSLKTDTLKFNTQTNRAVFLAPTLIIQDSSRIYTEAGSYDIGNSTAHLTKNPQYQKGAQIATADSITYDGKTKFVNLQGHARFEDGAKKAKGNTIRYDRQNDISYIEGKGSYEDETQKIVSDSIRYDAKSKLYATKGRTVINNPPQILEADAVDYGQESGTGYALGNVFWKDTSSKISIRCERATYRKSEDFIKAYGGRPMMTNFSDKDTLWLRADTIIALRENPKDSMRTLQAFRKVRMYQKGFQSVCDSLTYTQKDSLFRFFYAPIIWSDTSQLSADTMLVFTKDKQMEKVLMRGQAFVANSKDEVFFNEIKGRHCTAFFEKGKLARVAVEGNAESVYYIMDDRNAYIGVNKTICSEMTLHFTNGKVQNIRFFAEPKAKMTPMKKADHDAIQLKGFKWWREKRPKNQNDL